MSLLDLGLAIRDNPLVFNLWRFKERPDYSRRVLRRGDDAVIEGYPRSANTFANYAFVHAQGRPMKVGNHFHSPAQIHLAKMYRIPALVVVREPYSAALSMMVFMPGMSAANALTRYIAFHKSIIGISDAFVVAPFEEVTTNFGRSIERLNNHFGSSFIPFSGRPEEVEAVKARIESSRIRRKAHLSDLALSERRFTLPSQHKAEIRERLKAELDRATLAGSLDMARMLHSRMMDFVRP